MNLKAFEAGYAAASGMTVAELHHYGLRGMPCDCGEEGCHGWKMTTRFERRAEEIGVRAANRQAIAERRKGINR